MGGRRVKRPPILISLSCEDHRRIPEPAGRLLLRGGGQTELRDLLSVMFAEAAQVQFFGEQFKGLYPRDGVALGVECR